MPDEAAALFPQSSEVYSEDFEVEYSEDFESESGASYSGGGARQGGALHTPRTSMALAKKKVNRFAR